MRKGLGLRKFIFDFKTKILQPKLYRTYITNERRLHSENLYEINFNKRRKLVQHAIKHSAYYKEKYGTLAIDPLKLNFEKDFEELPILTREELRANFEHIISDNVLKKDYYKISTSGSSGPAITVLHDKRFPSAPIQWRLLQWWGVQPYENKAFIYRYPRTTLKKIMNTLLWWPTQRIFLAGTEMDEKHMHKFVQAINKTKPSLLQGYTDVVYEFALFVVDNKLQIHVPNAVWVTSGPLTKQQRSTMQKAFGAPVYDQYGSTEVLYVAAECSQQKGMHILQDMVYVECVDENNRPVPPNTMGKLLLTDLYNYAFPLIRYEIGDFGRLLSSKCSCGVPLPLMDNVKSRQDAVIKTPSGVQLNGNFLVSIFDDFPDCIRAYQFMQEKDYSLTLNYIPMNGKNVDAIISEVIHRLKEVSGKEIRILSKQVNQITKINGKAPMVLICK